MSWESQKQSVWDSGFFHKGTKVGVADVLRVFLHLWRWEGGCFSGQQSALQNREGLVGWSKVWIMNSLKAEQRWDEETCGGLEMTRLWTLGTGKMLLLPALIRPFKRGIHFKGRQYGPWVYFLCVLNLGTNCFVCLWKFKLTSIIY